MTDAEFEVYITDLELTHARVYKEAHESFTCTVGVCGMWCVTSPCVYRTTQSSGDKGATSIDITVVAPDAFTSKLTERSEWNLHKEIRAP
jgi:hypothetical protein